WSLSPLMATLSALMTMTKSPPSTLGVNVGLCLPRSRVAAATASRPSTTSVASMTYHARVVSPAFGVYVDTALTFFISGESRRDPGAGQASTAGMFSATDVDLSPLAYRTPTEQLTGGRCRRSKRVPGGRRISASAVDCDHKGSADGAHPCIGQPAEPGGEHCDRDAFN